jgi:microcystin-dependent protein
MAMKISNNAVSKLAATLTAVATSVTLMPGDGAKFPALTNGDTCPLYLIKADGTFEITKGTARVGDVVTVQRAQEGTAAISFAAGDRVELRFTAAAYEDRMAKPSMLGVIAMWGGAIADIPLGWKLCDGTNGTPDLRAKFIVGAGDTGAQYAVAATGGADTVALSVANLPAHSHGVNDPGHAHTISDPGHAHSINDPGHRHTPDDGHGFLTNGTAASLNGPGGQAYDARPFTNFSGTGITINGSGTGISINGAATGISIQNTGNGTAHENRPPYYALAFIQFKG